MATVNHKIEKPTHGPYLMIVWNGLSATDQDGDWVQIPLHSEKSVHVYSSSWGAGTLTFEGSNETEAPGKPVVLRDPQGAALSFTADGLKQVLEHTIKVRPKVSVAGTMSGTTVRLFVSTVRGEQHGVGS